MDESKFKRITGNLQSIRETLGHGNSDETEIWAQAGLVRLLQGPNQPAPFFLHPERTDFFEITGDVPPEIDSLAKTLRVVGGEVMMCEYL